MTTDPSKAAVFTKPKQKTEGFQIKVAQQVAPYFGAVKGMDDLDILPPMYVSPSLSVSCSNPEISPSYAQFTAVHGLFS